MSLLNKEFISILVDNVECRVFNLVHLMHIQSNFLANALYMLVIEVNTISKSLDCSLESEELYLIKSDSAFRFEHEILFLWNTLQSD